MGDSGVLPDADPSRTLLRSVFELVLEVHVPRGEVARREIEECRVRGYYTGVQHIVHLKPGP